MKRFLFSIFSAITLSSVLIACGSNVKLDDVPVENRTPSAVGSAAGSGSLRAHHQA